MAQTLITILFAGGVLALFVWLILPSDRKASASGSGATQRDHSSEEHAVRVGGGTGLLGGDIEDAAVARYSLSRTPKDPNSSDERDLGTALGMQNGFE